MRMEDHFKETLHRAVANEPPVLDAWNRFERRAGRARRWRFVAAFAGVAAVIVAAVIVVPKLGTSDGPKPGQLTTQPPTVIPTGAGAFPIDDWNTFKSADGYEVRYPRWWVTSTNEAVTEFRPYWLPGVLQGGDMIAATFRVEHKPMDEVKADPTWPEDATFIGLDPNRTLIAFIIQTDPELRQRYGWIARRILVSSLSGSYEGPGEPAPESLKHVGTVASGIASDARLETLIDFLDARLQSRGKAEEYLSPDAKQIYESQLSLYDWQPPGRVFYEYRVVSRQDADANSSEFVVEIITANASMTGMTTIPPSFRERIFVGAGRNHLGEQRVAVIRSAMPE